MNIEIKCDSLHTTSTFRSRIFLEIEGIEIPELLNQIAIEDIIEYLGKEEILDIIGRDKAAEYFELS